MGGIAMSLAIWAASVVGYDYQGYETKFNFNPETLRVEVTRDKPAPPMTNEIDLTQFPEINEQNYQEFKSEGIRS